MRNVVLAGLLVRAAAGMAAVSDSLLYSEKYRPQYHFTPAHRWIGDPCGTIRHNGRYLAYSWGAAERFRSDVAGINLCTGDGRKLTVSYDSESRYLTVDRTHTTDADMGGFDRIAYARVEPAADGAVELDIFVDKSTVEIFADGGKRVFTLLTYPSETQTGVSVYSLYGHTQANITAWPLASVWKR